ncbi:MAG: hypothetical protein AB7K68_05625 [Bacteriovoracia bacterium]
MKRFLLAIACSFLFFSVTDAHAFKSSHFKGSYQIISEGGLALAERQFVSIDVDTLEVMWSRYASGSFPANLEDLRLEPTLLIRFTGRDTNFFALEQNALIVPNYMSLRSEDKQFEIRTRADGKYDMAVTEKNTSTLYLISRM